MNIYALKGHKVKFTGQGGYTLQNEYARKHLEIGEIYTVDHTEVGQSSTFVYLEGLEYVTAGGQKQLASWNSVMFEDVVAQSLTEDKKHRDYPMWNN